MYYTMHYIVSCCQEHVKKKWMEAVTAEHCFLCDLCVFLGVLCVKGVEKNGN